MYYVRGVLEGSAAKLAAATLHPAKIEQVERELRSQNAGPGANLALLSEAGQSLHRLIVDNCGNQVLSNTIRSLQDHFVRFRHVSLQLPEKVFSSHREHLAILEALKGRDGEAAERLVREHFEHAARFLMESLLNRPEVGGDLRLTLPAAI
jgi:DNA-binding GntR family transcriptional regulator